MIEGSSGLGSLAQAARMKQLNTARAILLAIGILSTIANVVLYTLIESQVNEEVQKIQRQAAGRVTIDREAIAQAIRTAKLIQGGFVAVSVAFIVFGLIVKKYPVPITITALVLYISTIAIAGFLVPESIVQGWIIKIIIIAALASSIRAAVAYQREEDRLAAERGSMPESPAIPSGPTDFPPPKTGFPTT